MRWIRNAILIIFISIIFFTVLINLSPLFKFNDADDADDLNSIQFKDASVKIAYILNEEKWLSYTLQPAEELVRVMSNAIINLDYKINQDENIMYSINYEVLDEDENIIKSSYFYHRIGQKIYLDTDSNKQYVSTSIYPRKENTMDSRIHLINLRGLKQANKIRFKNGKFNYPIKKIALRTYQKKKISERKLDYAWQRMGEAKREKLSKVSVYDAHILNQIEQQELIKNQWAPLGPLGVDDENYVIQKLYVAREFENNVVINTQAVPSTGLVVYPNKYGIIILPEDAKKLKLSWSLFDLASRQEKNDKITIEWWGHPATKYKKWNSLISDGEFNLSEASGLIRISSDQPIVVRAWQTVKKKKAIDKIIEITPELAYQRLYSADKKELVYKINTVIGYKTPFRFDFRSLDSSLLQTISYRLLDKNNKQFKSGKLVISHQLSAYDAVVGEPQRGLTEPLKIYFNFPRKVSKIVFNAPSGVWISAYSRPIHLPHRQISPSQNYILKDSTSNIKQSVPVWFGVRPVGWKENMRKARSQLITIQRRAPQIDSDLIAGKYQWNQYYPIGNWKGRSLLSVADKHQIYREESAKTRYYKINVSKENKLSFISMPATNSLRASLMYFQDNKREMIISLKLNGKIFFEKKVHEKNGELLLPYMNGGDYSLFVESKWTKESNIIQSENVDFYINNIDSKSNHHQIKSIIKRVLIKLPNGKLEFELEKVKLKELLALRVYTNKELDKPIKVKVRINGLESRSIGPHNDWTLTNREYEFNKLDFNKGKNRFPVILNAQTEVSQERLFFIPLGSDIKSGNKYTIDITLSQPVDAYVVLTRSLPGLYSNHKIYPSVEIESTNE